MFKSYNFWVRLMAVLVLLLRIVLNEFGIVLDSGLVMDIATLVASILVVLGVINVPSGSGQENMGGSFMENFEKIKEDILKAKAKIYEKFGNNDQTNEIVTILTGIVGEEKVEEVSNNVEADGIIENTSTEPKLELLEDLNSEEKILEESVTNEENSTEEMVTSNENVETRSEEVLEIDESKLKEVLKEKLKMVIDKDFDDIISKVII